MRLTKRFMKRISFVLLVVCLCLSAVSCKKDDSLKTVYAHCEFILDDDETITKDIGLYDDFFLDKKYPIACDIYFSRDTSGNPMFECFVFRQGAGIEAHLAVSNMDSQIFIDGKDYYTNKGEKELIKETDNQHFRSNLYLQHHHLVYFEQARYRFDLVEQDGVCYSFSFEFTYSPEYSYSDDGLPHTLKGRIDVHNTYPGRKGYDSYIKKSE